MMDVDRATGAAKRLRERRLRSWWRHEAQSVQAAVVSALHHSRDDSRRTKPCGQKKTTKEQEAGLRALTLLPPGTRSEPLEEPLHWFTAGLEALCPVDGAPSLSLCRAWQTGRPKWRTLPPSASSRPIEMCKVLEEEERRKEEEQKKAARSSASSAPKRTRKKRRKRRLPRGVRIRRCGHGLRSRSSLSGACSASWTVCATRTVARSSSVLAVACARLVLLVTMVLDLCSEQLTSGPRWSTLWLVWTQKHFHVYVSFPARLDLLVTQQVQFCRCLPGGSVPVVCNNKCFGSRSADNC